MDLLDKKILCELDMNCRTPYSKIAKKLKVGRNVVDYRIKSMEKEGIIQKYICSLNLGQLGYKMYKLCFKTKSSNLEDSFVETIKNTNSVIYFLKCEGSFDYALSVAVKSIVELDNFLGLIKTKYSEMIEDYLVSIVVYSRIFKIDKFLLDKKNAEMKYEKHSSEESGTLLNNVDVDILKVLSENANLKLVEIAKITKLSIDVVKYRLKIINKFVNAYRVLYDTNKIGFYHYVILLRTRRATSDDEKKILGWCSLKNKVLYYSKRVGHYDFAISVAIKTLEEYNSFISEMRKEFSDMIDSYDTLIYSKVLKLNYVPF